MIKTKQAIRKNRLPAIAQKCPILAITKQVAERVNKIHPRKSIWRFVTLRFPSGFL